MAHFGMRGSGDWTGNVEPNSFRESLLLFYPNGGMDLTAITAMGKKSGSPVRGTTHTWFTKNLQARGGNLTAADEVYTEPTLTTKYTSGGVAGTVVYAKCAAATAEQFTVGNVVVLSAKGEYRSMVRGMVLSRGVNGANSYVQVELLEAANATYDLDTANYIQRIGNANPEGGDRPEAQSFDPVEYWNYTQIFRNPYGITGTQKEVELRPMDALDEAMREALEYHGLDIEQALIFGERDSKNGANGKKERKLRGIIPWLVSESTTNGNVEGFSHSATYSGLDWLGNDVAGSLENGEMWLNEKLEVIFRYGTGEKLGICGSGALLGINQLAASSGQMNLVPRDMHYGLKVMEWITPFGSIFLKTHPLFSQTAVNRYDMLIVDPSKIHVRPLGARDTKPIDAVQDEGRDAEEGEWLTEITMEFHEPAAHGYLTRVGLNHDQTI
jgi:hypothetical protein